MAEKGSDKTLATLLRDMDAFSSDSGVRLIITPNVDDLDNAIKRPRGLESWEQAAQKPLPATSAAALLLNKDGTVEHQPEIVAPTDKEVFSLSKLTVPSMMADFLAAMPKLTEGDLRNFASGVSSSQGKLYGLPLKHKGQRREP